MDVLRRADAAAALPRLGGMARPNGVVIVSERYWAFAGVDGSLREGAMPRLPQALERIPLTRGLVRLSLSLAPLFRRGGVTRRAERWLIAAALVGPLGLALLGGPWSTVGGIALSAALVLTILRGRALHLHGAEHRAIAAAESRQLCAAWAGDAAPTRFSPRCGTNFAALAAPATYLVDRVLPFATAVWAPAVALVLSLALTMELWRVVQSSPRRVWRLFLLPGLGLQRLTTREPRLDETRVALAAVASVLERELA